MAQNYGPKIVTNGLILSLDAADKNSYPGSGTTWFDTSGRGNNVVLLNGPSFLTNNFGVLSFDGTDDQAYTSQTINFAGNFTLGMWVKVSRWADPSCPCGGAMAALLQGADGYWNMWGLETNSGGPYFFTYYNTSYGGISLGFNAGGLLNQWMYLTVTYVNLGTCVSYLNGVAQGSGISPGTINPNVNMYINARSQHCGFCYSQNQTSRIEVYNRALSSTEVLQNYLAIKNRFRS